MANHDTEKGQWVGIDLHVHTPASRDYKGPRDDSEYLNILRRANELTGKNNGPKKQRSAGFLRAPLGCIAFTDHNSVEGYRKHRELYNAARGLSTALRARDPKNPLFEQLDDELKTWESVRLLMGVEIKADPGIDLLVILHESVEPTAAVEFLEAAYGRKYGEFVGDPTRTTGKTARQTLQLVMERFGNKALVIAPHIDSSGGVWEGSKTMDRQGLTSPRIRVPGTRQGDLLVTLAHEG